MDVRAWKRARTYYRPRHARGYCSRMARTEEHLQRWLAAGVITADVADAVRRHEATPEPAAGQERPGALEALLYLGLAVLGGGIFALLAQQWDELKPLARMAAIGVPTALMFAVGLALRTNTEPQLRRGGQAAWMMAVPLSAAFMAIAINEYGLGFEDLDSGEALLAVAAATFLVAVVLWAASPAAAQVFAIAAATVFLGQAVGNWPDEFSQAYAGLTFLAIAGVVLTLAEAGWFKPALAAMVLFSALAIAGPYLAGVGDGHIAFELLAAAVAAGVVAYGVFRESFAVVLVGVAGAFVVLVTFIFEHFSKQLGAPLAMMLSGGLMVAAVLLLSLYRRETRAGRAA